MNIISFLVGRLFPSRIVSVFLAWIGCIFVAASNYCLLFLSPNLPQRPFILAILAFPILTLGFMISMIQSKLVDRLVTYGLLFEILLLIYLSTQLIWN